MSVEAASAWNDICLSVNVSPVQLRNPDFAALVEHVLETRGFDPEWLTLEITEGVLLSNVEQAKRTIARLKAIGVKFALDDFGCGYASIGALHEFGFDRMKIDRLSRLCRPRKARGSSLQRCLWRKHSIFL